MLADRALCGEGGCTGLMVGEGAVAVVRGDWLPCLLLSPPIREDMDIDGPDLDAKPDKSRTPAKGDAAGGGRGAGTGKEEFGGAVVVGDGGGMVRDAKDGGGGGGSSGPMAFVLADDVFDLSS